MLRSLRICLGAAAALAAASAPAWADLTCPISDTCFNLNTTGSGSTQNAQVALQQMGANEVQVTVTLNPALAEQFASSTTDGPVFGFDVNGIKITSSEVSGLTSGFGFSTQPFDTGSPFGTYQYAIVDTKSGAPNNPLPGPIRFDITLKSGSLPVSAIGGSFVASLFRTDCDPFIVAHLPEAPTPYFLVAGLLGFVAFRRRFAVVRQRRS